MFAGIALAARTGAMNNRCTPASSPPRAGLRQRPIRIASQQRLHACPRRGVPRFSSLVPAETWRPRFRADRHP
jgi:hypothetical protein